MHMLCTTSLANKTLNFLTTADFSTKTHNTTLEGSRAELPLPALFTAFNVFQLTWNVTAET